MTGLKVDWSKVKDLYPTLNSELKEIERRLDEYFEVEPGTVNWGSSNQVGKLLEDNGWPDLGRSKAGFYLTNKDCMVDWEKLGYEGASIFLERSGLNGVINTFVGEESEGSGAWQYRGTDGAMHPQFLYCLAASHRLRSKQPNAQNWPKNGKYAKIIRKIFTTPDENYGICEGDYSGLQLRVASVMSGDENMRRVFLELGGDMHSMTAHSVFCRNPKDLIEVEYEDGTVKKYPEDWKVKVKRNGKIIETILSDIQEGEDLL